jgi:hypothetical protein
LVEKKDKEIHGKEMTAKSDSETGINKSYYRKRKVDIFNYSRNLPSK